jgi:hypothetical protein
MPSYFYHNLPLKYKMSKLYLKSLPFLV